MATDISNLKPKVENEGSTDAGRLTAGEWNSLVTAVEENQREVRGAIKGINYNGTTYSKVVNGILEMNVVDTSGRNFKFEWIQRPNQTIAKGGSCIVEFNVIDQTASDEDKSVLVPYHNPGKITFYVDDKQVGVENGVYSKGSSNYKGPIKFDFSKATTLSTKTDGNSLKIVYTNSGLTREEYFTVNVLDLNIIANVEKVYTTDNPTDVTVTIRGAKCKLYASVDEEYINGVDAENKPKPVGETIEGNAFHIKDQLVKYNTHGIHNIKIWAEPIINNVDIVTDTFSYNYIFGDKTSTVPVVMSTINDGAEYELYSKLQVDYVAYLSGSNGKNRVNIALTDNTIDSTYIDPENPESSKGVLLNTSQEIEFIDGVCSGSYIFTLFPKGNEVLIGDNRRLIIGIIDSNGVEHKHIVNIVIKESSITLTQADGYAAYFTSMGRSNSESADTLRKWESIAADGTGLKTTVTFDDNIEFLDTGSGWCKDKDGNIAMHLRKGKGFTLNYKPFTTNPTYGNDTLNANGLTISIEFATRNCLKDNAQVISCMDYTHMDSPAGRGFYVTASEAKLLANDIELGVKFKEDTRIKIDFVIEGKPTNYPYNTVVGTDPTASDYTQIGSSDECLAIIFVDGVYAGLTLIKKSTTFLQGNTEISAKEIRFGSDDCDLDVYNIRIYNKALTINEIVQNYSYDTPNQLEKIEIAQRNDIFSTANNNMPVIDTGKLRSARPALPFFYVTLDPSHTNIMPQNKSDWKRLTMTTFDNPLADGSMERPAGADIAKSSFEAVTGVLRNQGTSSMTYPWPWRNWDWKTGDSDFGDKSTFLYYFPKYNDPIESGSKWHQYDYTGSGDNLAIKKITLKKDYASSEMCNNAICSEIFTDMALGIAGSYPEAVSPAMRMDLELNKKTDLRLSLKAMPSVMFQNLPNPNDDGSAGKGLDCMGMMNIIPNKNEVGYLGFKKNKWEDDANDPREQSWELCDNLDGVFWVKPLEGIKYDYTDESFTNDVKDVYEARTPKDSSVKWGDNIEADFGMTPKGLKTMEKSKADAVNDELQDIVNFHNWLVSCNRYLANPDEPINNSPIWNTDSDGNYLYTHDTPEYRLAKFKNEAPDRLLLDQWILYYIWREQFWMFDSGFKNLQVYTVGPRTANGPMQWGCMVRDADTALGIENTGRDYFPPHIEDVDYYTESDGKITFHYDKARDIYDINMLKARFSKDENGNTVDPKAVLNGQFGSVWINIRDAFSAEIGQMYRTLTNNYLQTNFGAEPAIKKFRGHQEHWCESLYNFGMRQYFGGKPFSYFNKSGLGDKKNSRSSWLERGFYYRRGKYSNLADNSAFRINTYESAQNFDKVLNVKSYIPMYIGCGGTTAEMINSKNVIRLIPDTYEDGSIGKPISVGEEGFNFPNTGDAVSYIYGTSMITDIGDLARVCKLLRVQTLSFPKLREFNLGHESARDGQTYMEFAQNYVQNENGDWVADGSNGEEREFRNEILASLDCSSMTQLTLLDVTNHTNLSELVIDTCDQLQYLYARGTILKSIDLPKTTSLKKIYLGSTLTSLELVDLTGIEEFVIEGLNNCGKLTIQNCGDYMATESYNIVSRAINALVQAATNVANPKVCSLRGIKWDNVTDNSLIEKLLYINADLTGEMTLRSLSNDLKVKLSNRYGDIDTGAGGLKVNYPPIVIKSAELPSKLYIYKEGTHQLAFTVNPISANTYKSAKWELGNSAAKYAMIDETTGVITRNSTPSNELDDKGTELKVTIYQIPDENGNEREPIVITSTVYFYERIAKPGDIVFNDGSYSDELISGKTPIGVCFYVRPVKDAEGNVVSYNRLMMAINSISLNNRSVIPWGMGPGTTYTGGDKLQYLGTDPDVKLSTDITYDCFDIEKLNNVTSYGANITGTDNTILSNDNYRDISDTDNDKFKKFTTGCLAEIGWRDAEYDLSIDKLNLPNGDKAIYIKEGDSLPIGYFNTLAIIEHRNKILDDYNARATEDGNPDHFVRPATKYNNDGTIQYTEYAVLSDLIDENGNKAVKWPYESRTPDNVYDGKTYGNTLYYPAASACFAYEPEAANLDDKFKKHNWFLPAAGDVVRMLYYCYNANLDEISNFDDDKSFKNALSLNVLSLKNFYVNSLNYIETSTEYNRPYIWVINSKDGSGISSKTKYSSGYIRPICRF